MMSITQELYQKIETLPPESLTDLAQYIEFLRFKTDQAADAPVAQRPLRLVKLRGLLKGYDFSPELLAETRHVTTLVVDANQR